MELTEIVLAIVFSGLLIVIMLAVYFVCKSRLQQIKIIKRAVADLKLEQSELKEPLPEYKSIEEKTFRRYRLVKLQEDKYNGRDNTVRLHTESVTENKLDILSLIQLKSTSKKFSRLDRVI